MIYLIVQMITALVLAAICGGAIGWLIHRTTHAKHIDKLRRSLSQHQRQLAQSQSEISMLSDDYEDLQRRSQDEIDRLREDTEQIPVLSTNLEKSQLLVRQMMQKHESKLRDLNGENESLTAKLKNLENREQASNTVKAELDRVRDKSQAAPDQNPDQNTDSSIDVNATAVDSESANSELSATDSADNSSDNSKGKSANESADESLASSPTSVVPQDSSLPSDPHSKVVSDQASGADVDFFSGVATTAGLGKAADAASRSATTPDTDKPYDADAVADAIANPASDTAPDAETIDNTDSTTSTQAMPLSESESESASEAPTDSAQISDARSSGSWASASVVSSGVASFSDSADDNLLTTTVSASSITTDELAANEPDSELPDNDSAFDSDPFDNVMEVGDELQREIDIDADLMLDGSNDASCLFEPVEHRDDLKQIFGIGPVTEKALNELGITSYSQLAHLKDHDIEKIAGALEIVPGRIERDDWVGNARRQLEDVLEEL